MDKFVVKMEYQELCHGKSFIQSGKYF